METQKYQICSRNSDFTAQLYRRRAIIGEIRQKIKELSKTALDHELAVEALTMAQIDYNKNSVKVGDLVYVDKSTVADSEPDFQLVKVVDVWPIRLSVRLETPDGESFGVWPIGSLYYDSGQVYAI